MTAALIVCRLTKGAPTKSKLQKKSVGEVSAFQESAKVLFQEVEVRRVQTLL